MEKKIQKQKVFIKAMFIDVPMEKENLTKALLLKGFNHGRNFVHAYQPVL